jgi:hypothetical protein
MNKKYKFDPTNPTASYESRNTSQMDALTNQYMNRGAFSYDSNTDKAFQDYANIMLKNGNMAMKDTAAKAASMTGGFGNSYAQTAGQSVYNNYVDQIGLAEREFRNDALAQYNAAGNDLLSKLGLLERQEARDKAAWEDDYANAYAMAQNAATYNGDYSGLAKFMGISDPQALKDQINVANATKPTDKQIQGYKDAILFGNPEEYLRALTAQGVNTTEFWNMADTWMQEGAIPAGSIKVKKDENGEIIDVTYGDTSLPNATIGLNKIKEGEKFHVKNTTGSGEDNWNVKLGKEVTDENSEIKKYGKNKNGLFVYHDILYYADGTGGVFKVEDQNDWLDGDDLTYLRDQIKNGG